MQLGLEKIIDFLEHIDKSVENFQKILALLKKIYKAIEYLIIMIYVFIISIQFKFIRNKLLDLNDEKIYQDIINWVYSHSNLCLFLLLVVIIGVYLYKIWKLGKMGVVQLDNNENFVQKLHIKFIHDIRDNVKELDKTEKILCNGNADVIQITRKSMFQILANNMQNYVDFISELLTEYCKTTISVCIKIVTIENNDINNPLAMTLVRSTNTRKKRLKNNETVKINENDDFKYLYNGANTFFGAADLISKHNEGNYNVEERIDIWKDKYKSTLIAPIRYYSKHSRNNNVDVEFEILGFLCIDANEILPQWEDINSYELKILAIFADTMYIYLKRYNDVYCIGKREN